MTINTVDVLEDQSIVQRQKDNALRDAAKCRLAGSPYLQLRRIRCHARCGVLRLLGTVSSYYLRQVAQATVQGLAGIEALDNQLDVISN